MQLIKLSLLTLVCFSIFNANADAIRKSQAMSANTIIEYYIDEQGVRAELEIGQSAIADFKDLLPEQIYRELGFGEAPYQARLQTFLTQGLALLAKDGTPLEAELVQIGPARRILRDSINGTPLPVQYDAPVVVEATILYKFPYDKKTEQLIFKSPGAQDIGFVVYHKGVAVNDFRYIASGYTLYIDWSDPWYTSFRSGNLRRQYSAPMNGFIYVEPFEVRKEIIARPKDLQRWIDLGLEGKETISVDMQDDIKRKVGEFLSKHHPVTIDGKPVAGILDSVNFLERTLNSSRVLDAKEPINIDAAILGAIFVYPRTGLPNNVVMTWDLWDERIKNVPVAAVDQAGPLPSLLQEDWNKLVWTNYLKNPIVPTLNEVELPAVGWRLMLNKSLPVLLIVLTIALFWLVTAVKKQNSAAKPKALITIAATACVLSLWLGKSNNPQQERAQAIVGDLLHNLYRSFDYREESDIYDVLSGSVTGELLTDIFLEIKHSLVLANQGGAQAKVKAVALEKLALKPNDEDNSFTVEADWTVHGAVGHWGHVHQRSNRYQALLTLVVENQQWKLKLMTVLQQERL